MARDHELFVGWDNPYRHATVVGTYLRAARFVRRRVKAYAEPCGLLANTRADDGRSLADPGREHQPVETSEGRRQHTGDVCVRESVKAVAANAGLGKLPGEGEGLGNGGLAAMEGGIKTGHLGKLGAYNGDCLYGGQIVRLMQRCQWHQGLELAKQCFVDLNWPDIVPLMIIRT